MILRILRVFLQPQYLLRPSQIVRRIARRLRGPVPDVVTVTLPWGTPIRCRSRDVIGLNLQHLGLFELGASEVLRRLADDGELAMDAGANIGQMTAILAHRVGPSGPVLAFEPNEAVLTDLEFNVAAWRAQSRANIVVHAVALSDHDGPGALVFPRPTRGIKASHSSTARRRGRARSRACVRRRLRWHGSTASWRMGNEWAFSSSTSKATRPPSCAEPAGPLPNIASATSV